MKNIKKLVFDKRRHIKQKTSSDCELSSIAMYFNMPWETIVDLYSTEVLSVFASLPSKSKNDPDYYETLFNEVFYDPSSPFSGMTDITTAWLLSVLGVNYFVELPYLIKREPCIISTYISTEYDGIFDVSGHAMYFDGAYVYDPNWDVYDPRFNATVQSMNTLNLLPSIASCLYILDGNQKLYNKLKHFNAYLGLKDSSGGKRFITLIPSKDEDHWEKVLKSKNPNMIMPPFSVPVDTDDEDTNDYVGRDSLTFSELNKLYKKNNMQIMTSEYDEFIPLKWEVSKDGVDWHFEDFNYKNSHEIFKEYYTLSELKDLIAKGNLNKIKDQDQFKRSKNPTSKYAVKYLDINIGRNKKILLKDIKHRNKIEAKRIS